MIDMNKNDRKVVPNRIKQARISRGYSMGELAELIDVTRQSISQYELGKTVPSTSVIVKLSDILKYPTSFFYKEIPTNDNANSAVFFRSRRTTTIKEKAACIEKISIFSEINEYLRKYIDFPEVDLPKVDYDYYTEEAPFEKIQEYVDILRQHWKLGKGPIENLTFLVQQNGIMQSCINMNYSKIDGLSVWYDGIPYIFMSKEKECNVRLRFGIAHELGHLIMHAGLFGEDDIKKTVINNKLEHEANLFASAFLMPEETFSRDIYSTSLDHFIQLKKKWNVSIAAMIMRCESLDLLTENQVKYLNDQLWKRGYRKREPLDDVIPVEYPFAHKQAFKLLLDNNIVTVSQLVDEIGCYASEIEEYSYLEKGTLKLAEDPNKVIKLRVNSRM